MKIIQPVNGHIVLQEVSESEQMVGNIFLPDMGKEKTLLAKVVNVCNTYNYHQGKYKQSEVQVDDLCVVPRMGSQIVSIDDEDFC